MDNNPELDALYNDLKTKVDALVKDFWHKISTEMAKAASSSPAAASATQGQPYSVAGKNLPWFQHGVRGFLRKLWYGDHPENPSWNRLQQSESVHKISLSEYATIRAEIDSIVVENFGEGLGTEFANSLMNLVMSYMQQAHKLGYERNTKPTDAVAPTPESPPTESPPTASAPEEPASAAKTIRKRVGGARMKSVPQDAIPVTNGSNRAPFDPSSDKSEWEFKTDDGHTGKVDFTTLQMYAKTGRITPDTVIKRDYDAEWYKASSLPELKFSKKKAKPATAEPPTEVDHQKIEDVLPNFLIAKQNEDKEAQEAALKEAGIRFTNKGLKDEASIETLVYFMKALCNEGYFDLADIDWVAPNSYKDIFHKLPPGDVLLKVIHKVRTKLKSAEKTNVMGRLANTAAEPSVDPLGDCNLSNRVTFFKKLLREGSGHFFIYEKMRALPQKDKVKFLKENLTV